MIKVFPDTEELNVFAAEKLIEIGNDAIEKRGRFSIALAGGSTPKSLYRLLTTGDFKNRINWKKTFFFFGDERSVPPDDDESNFRMADENLLNPLQIGKDQVFRWQTELNDAAEIAADYEKTIKEFFSSQQDASSPAGDSSFPAFDLILLGMGPDGHTASLFPETGALRETEKIAVANWVEKLKTFRLTLTLPAINNALNVMFLANGAEKAQTLKEVLRGASQPEKFPSQAVKPVSGDLFWLIDKKAAEFLT